MRRFVPFLLPALVLSAGEVQEEILVVVNNHLITRKTFQQAVEQEHAALYRQYSGKELDAKLQDAREKTLQGLIDSYILGDKATELGIVIPDDYLRNYVDEIKKQNNFSSDADFERALRASAGVSLPEFLKRQKQEIIRQEVLRREIYAKIAIEDQELRAYYEDHKDEYRQPSRFRIRELVLPKGTTDEEKAATAASLQAIHKALAEGASFEELARTYSTSPSKSTGGDLGWMGKGLLLSSIEQAALRLKPGQISAAVETDKDVYLVQLVASEEDLPKPFEEVKAQILSKLQEPKAQNAIENYLNSLRIRANVRYMVPRDKLLKG
nr:peptidyl-prolyl cis-trans isomerase [uncultured Holophaga sp.]